MDSPRAEAATGQDSPGGSLTSRIWTYWHQGWKCAPSIVRQCVDSWIRLNPDYQVCALDRDTLLDAIDFPAGVEITRPDLTVQKISGIGRLAAHERLPPASLPGPRRLERVALLAGC